MGVFSKARDVAAGAVDKVGSGIANGFGKDLKPLDLLDAMKAEAEAKKIEVGRDRIVIPNKFTLTVSPNDFDKIEGWGPETLVGELETNVEGFAADHNYAFVGNVAVYINEGVDLQPGQILVDSESERTPAINGDLNAPGALPLPTPGVADQMTASGALPGSVPAFDANARALAGNRPIVDVNGVQYVLEKDVTVIGRGSECDIILDDSGSSRKHIQIKVTDRGVIAEDLGSTNGMFVEGHQVPAATLLNGNTLTVGRTRIIFWENAIAQQQVLS